MASGQSPTSKHLPTNPLDAEEQRSPGGDGAPYEAGWANAQVCGGCGEAFTAVFRRHHCRQCLRSYCYRCSHVNENVGIRLCDGCTFLGTILTADDSSVAMSTLENVVGARHLLPQHRSADPVINVFVRHLVGSIVTHSFDAAASTSYLFEQAWPHVQEESMVNALSRHIAVLAEKKYDADALERLQWAIALRTKLASGSRAPTLLRSVVTSAAKIGQGVGVIATPQCSKYIVNALSALVATLHGELLSDAKQHLSGVLEELGLAEDEEGYDSMQHGYANENNAEERASVLQALAASRDTIQRLLTSIDALCTASSEVIGGGPGSSQRFSSAMPPSRLTFASRLRRVEDICKESDTVVAEAEDVITKLKNFLDERQLSRDRFAAAHSSTFDESSTAEDNHGAEQQAKPAASKTKRRTLVAAAAAVAELVGSRVVGVPKNVRALLPDITARVQREVFVGWGKREYDAENRRLLEALHAEDLQRTDRLLSAEALDTIRAVMALSADLNGPNREEALSAGIRQYGNLLSSPSVSITDASTAEDVLCMARKWLSKQPKCALEAVKLSDIVARSAKQANSAQKSRQAMYAIGGTAVTLETSDHISLDGVFVTVQGFLNAIKAVGGMRCSIAAHRHGNGATGAIVATGFAFPKTNSDNDPSLFKAQAELVSNLTTLSFASIDDTDSISTESPPAHDARRATASSSKSLEWTRVDIDMHQPYWVLVPTHTSFDPLSYGRWDFSHHTLKVTPILPLSCSAKTVILTSGAIGVYEAQKREIMAFVSRGVNVLGFNYRGYGRSDGVPNENSMLVDIEAAYAYLRDVENVCDNSDIAVKSLCMSGVAGAHLAGKYPGMHLLLDQTYSDFGGYLGAEVRRMLRQTALFRLLPTQLSKASEYVVSEFVKRHAPKWNVAEKASLVTGSVGVFITEEDVNTPKEEALKNIQAVMRQGNARVRSYVLPGEHATVWLDCVSATVSPMDLCTASIPQSCVKVLKDQAHERWKQLEAVVRAFRASVTSDVEFEEALLCNVQEVLANIHVQHEETEVCVQRLKNVCEKLHDVAKCQQSLKTFSSADDCGKPAPHRLQMISFHRSPHPGRVAIDDFLSYINFFAPIHVIPPSPDNEDVQQAT